MEPPIIIPLEHLRESPFNPRKHYNEAALEQLAETIKSDGLLQPILVRPLLQTDLEYQYEVVFGHRRFRAHQLAGLPTIKAFARDMTDQESRRAQLVENGQRDDVHPFEEAQSYQELIDEHNLTADDLVKETGKSRSHIYSRLALLKACPAIRDACISGEIGSEVALLIARLRLPKLQEKALGYIKGKYLDLGDGGKASYRRIRDLLNERFTLDLDKAMFDIEDEMLVPDAGHCIRCPKRSGNAPEYADVVEDRSASNYTTYSRAKSGPNVCTDPDCFDEKKKAHLKRKAAELAAKGKVVVDGAKARQAIDATGQVKGAYIALKDVKAELKSVAGEKPQVITIQDPRTGKTVEAIKRDDLKSAGVKVKEAPKRPDYAEQQRKHEEERRKLEEKAKAERTFRRALLDRVRAAAATTERTALDLQLVAYAALAGVGYYDQDVIADLYKAGNRAALEQRIARMDLATLSLFVLDCALVHSVGVRSHTITDKPEPLYTAAKQFGINVDQLRAELTGPASTPSPAAQAKGKAKASAKKTKPKRPAKPKPEPKNGELDLSSPSAGGSKEEMKDDAGVAGELTADEVSA